VTIGEGEDFVQNTGRRGFHFEAAWVGEENCEVTVNNAWRLSMRTRGGKVAEAVMDVACDLWDWSKNVLGDLGKRIKHARKALEMCRRSSLSQDSVAREEVLKYRLERLEEQRELYWRQRAKVHWLKHGDRNTKYFHRFASERRKNNRIRRLVREDGEVVTDEDGILSLVTSYYRSLFTTNEGDRYDELLQHVPQRVTDDMNDSLLKDYSDEEIKYALDCMGDLKAPGPDGIPALFYKKYWNIVGQDVCREVRSLLNGGEMPEKWNETVVVLIPKIANPDKLKDLRPISLCNVVYKIVSKVISNRLKLVLGVQVDYNVVHLRTSLVQLFVLLLRNFEKVVQMIELKRFGGAPNGYPLCTLNWFSLISYP
jgi:hypothetical protein